MTQPDTDAESPCKRIGVFIETLWQHLDRHTRRDMRLLAALNEANAELARLESSVEAVEASPLTDKTAIMWLKDLSAKGPGYYGNTAKKALEWYAELIELRAALNPKE